MKLCNLDGEQYLLTVPNRTQMLEFQKLQEVLGNGEMEQYRLDGYYYQQMYPHPQGTQSSIMVRNKKEKETPLRPPPAHADPPGQQRVL